MVTMKLASRYSVVTNLRLVSFCTETISFVMRLFKQESIITSKTSDILHSQWVFIINVFRVFTVENETKIVHWHKKSDLI
jgi:glycerol-3-phosphate responsive antiterminator